MLELETRKETSIYHCWSYQLSSLAHISTSLLKNILVIEIQAFNSNPSVDEIPTSNLMILEYMNTRPI